MRNALFIAASNGLNCRPVYPGKKKPRFRGAFRFIWRRFYIFGAIIFGAAISEDSRRNSAKSWIFQQVCKSKTSFARACLRVLCKKRKKNLGACLLPAARNRAAEVARRCKTASNPAQFFAARAEGKLSRAKSKSKFAAIPQLFRSLPPTRRNILLQAHLSEGDCACVAIARFKVQ